MLYRAMVLLNDNFYHVYNRGTDSIPIFKYKRDYNNFLELLNFYRYRDHTISFSTYKKLNLEARSEYWEKVYNKNMLVEILAFVLMPNHFHLTIKQNVDHGIKNMMSNIQISHSKTFNLKNNRKVPLFESRFYAKHIETDEQLLHLSRYQHLNPVSSGLIEIDRLESFEWSSYACYSGKSHLELLNTELILDLIGGAQKYKEFVEDQANYQYELHKIKHLVIK